MIVMPDSYSGHEPAEEGYSDNWSACNCLDHFLNPF